MTKSKKIELLIKLPSHLNPFFYMIKIKKSLNDLDDYEYYGFERVFKTQKNNLNKEIWKKLKPFIKINIKVEKYSKKVDKLPPKKRKMLKKIKRTLNSALIVRYKKRIIHVQDINKKYTYALGMLAVANSYFFVNEFIKTWNKHKTEKVVLNETELIENHVKKCSEIYIDNFTDYFKKLQ